MKKSLCVMVFLAFTATVSAQITSTFDTDVDGWTYFSNATSITVNHQTSGGNPGGYVSVTYSSNTSLATQNWIAPSKFLGNHLVRSLGMNLKFNLQQSQAGTTSGYDVRIENGGTFINFTLPVKPAVAPAWSSYSLSLDENTAWKYNGSATNATRSQIKAILVNVTSIEIRGAYATNASYTSGLDNVILEQRTLTPAPVASSLSTTSGKSGDVITINGSGFNTTASANSVSFGPHGGIGAVVQSATATQLQVVVPAGAGYGPLIITNTATGLSTKTLTPFNPLFDGGGRIIPASFKPKFDLPTIEMEGVFVADIDGDGWTDVAAANNNADDVIDIYRNLGLGGDLSAASFAPKVTVPIPPLGGSGTNGAGLWFADLDGDGKTDAISSNASSAFGAVFITLRNISTPGTVAFEAPEYWGGASDETPIALVADLDGDGRPELMAGEGSLGSTAGTYFWAIQNISAPGNIDFGSPIGFFNGTVINGFAVAISGDLDGDGKNELVITHNFGQVFTVLKNTSTPGLPSFTNAFTISTNQYNSSIHVVDMNLDGKNDLVYKISGETGVHIRLNANSGGALVAADFSSDVIIVGDLTTYGGISIADVNGDGKPDIAVSDNGDVGVYENNYSGGVFDATAFVPAYQYQGSGTSTYPTSPIVADLNGDSKPEIIVGITNTSPNKFSIYQNRNVHAPVISLTTVSPLKGAVGSTVTITGNNFSTVPSENNVWFGAVEANVLTATVNIITVEVPAGAAYAPVSVTKNGLTSRYHLPFQTTFGLGVNFDNTHFAPPVSYTLTGAGYNIDPADLNADGTVDILASGGNTAYAFRNDYTSGSITTSTLVANDTLSPTTDLFGNPRLEDFDGDGYLDVASINTRIRRNITTGSNINFTPNITYTGQGNLAYSDFNMDGKIDMAVANAGSAQLNLIENRTVPGNFTTTGTFGSFSSTFVFGKPSVGGDIISADFDADGFPDVVTTNPGTDNISIFSNLGGKRITTAQFAARVDVAVGDNPNRIYRGDFDSDGKLDLMLYHSTGTSTTLLIVFHNTSTPGNISFSRIDLTNPSAATVAHVADLDGDGRPEIISTSEAGNQFSIFKNIHTSGALTAASFAAPFNTTVTAPRGITTADINLDGKPEIILTRAAGLLLVYENLIAISPPTITSFTPTSGPVGTSVTITGTNFDATPANNIVYFGATRAVVTAATPTQLTVTVPIGATYQPISVSVNSLLAYSSKPFITTFAGGGTIDACSFAPKQDLTAGMFPLSIVSGDFDGDGKADMAVANYDNNILSLFRNTSSIGSISYAPKIDITSGSNTDHISTDDLDGDGKLDLVVTDGGGASVYHNTSTGAGTISFAARISFAVGGSDPRHLAIDDFDKDGKPDLVVANYGAGVNTISVLRNTSSGPGNITYATKVDFASTARPSSVSAGDLDGDSKPDIAVVNQNSNTLSVFRNTSTGIGNISFAAKVDFTTGSNPVFVSIGDLDDDNKPEIAVGHSLGTSSSVVSVFRNLSSGIGNISYAPQTDFTVGSIPFSVSIGDIDGDGKPDLVAANVSSGNVSVLRNTSTGIGNISFAGKVDFTTSANSQSVSITDFDGDGKPDLAATSFFGVHVLRNTISFSPTITSFTPTNGAVGTTITITGTNFSTTPVDNTVEFFNGVNATVTSSTSTNITTTVPPGATTGKISVTVNCNTVVSASDFTVSSTTNQPPIIAATTTAVPIGGIITLNLEPLISDPDNNLDANSLYLVNSISEHGASASLDNAFILTLDYGSVQFFGTDRITVGVCDLLSECAEQDLAIEVGGNIIVYNALSPSDNQHNQIFKIQYIDILPETQQNKVTIYNRWGDVVWEDSDYDNSTVVFEGISTTGKDLPSGTYFYRIEFRSGLESITGFLSLKR